MTTVPFAPLPMLQADVEYAYGPDSEPRPGTTAGRTTRLELPASRVFPGTARSVWLHVPAGVPADRPVACTILQDGWWYLDPAGVLRCGVVLDNLVACGAVPPMVGVFVDPGTLVGVADPEVAKHRNAEYDAADDRYAALLVDEVLPLVAEHVTLRSDAAGRALCGGSSGGNASFTAAWHRPDCFGRVVALGASFPQMPGGNPYPDLLARTPRKPLRVLLSTAHRDLQWNEPEQNWFAETLLVAAGLAKGGWDFRLVLREGGHSMVNGGALLPDALRWVWAEPER